MVERSDEIRQEIELTREQMGETVDAISYKANVPLRTADWVGEKKDALASRMSGAGSRVGEATPSGEQVKERGLQLKDLAERNPFGLLIAGAAVGFIAGLFAPATRVEDERLGPVSDQLKTAATNAGQEALERGKQVAQEAAESAAETVKERGREESQELAASVRNKATETTPISP
jgi:hypothetical protein